MAKVQVNPEVLRWARETAGLTLADAAEKLGIQFARDNSPAQRLESMESGDELPTRPLLLKMSKQYHRPLIAFYLERPPVKANRGEDFRRLPDGYTDADDAPVDALLRDIRARQSIVRAAMEDDDDTGPIGFVGATRIDNGVERVSELIRNSIAFNLEAFRAQRTSSDAFVYLRTQAEAAGVFVLLIGDLGSYRSRLSVEAFRGFALSDSIAPFIVINDQDARAAWSFSLLHELAHISLGQTGISGAVPANVLEQFCNDVAGAILLPAAELRMLGISNDTEFAEAIEEISGFARARRISRAMVAYKLFRSDKISFERWNQFRIEFRRQWLEYREEQRQQHRDAEGGPDYYVVRRQRVGAALVNFVSRTLASGALSLTKAGKVLGVKPQNVYELVQQHR